MTIDLSTMNRRRFLQYGAAFAVSPYSQLRESSGFIVGLVPAGKTRVETAVLDFWSHCDEVAKLGVHHIEFNNTRARVAEAYIGSTSEFEDRMLSRGLVIPGIAQFSHMDRPEEFPVVLKQHLLLGEFLSKTGGKYITHMIAPASVLNEVDDEEAYRRIDLRTWVANANEVGRQVFERWGVKLAITLSKKKLVTIYLKNSYLPQTNGTFALLLM